MDERVTTSQDLAEPIPVAVKDLTKVYGTVTAVNHISFALKPRTTVALLGGNGAGKTTTIAMLLGLVVPTSGEVHVFGADMSRNRYQAAGRLNFQSPYVDLPMRLTVRQNLVVYAGLYGIANAAERIGYLADDLQIAALLDRPTGKLSAGPGWSLHKCLQAVAADGRGVVVLLARGERPEQLLASIDMALGELDAGPGVAPDTYTTVGLGSQILKDLGVI